MEKSKVIDTLMATSGNLDKDEGGKSVEETICRGMINSLLYLTSRYHGIMFVVCLCACFQASLKESHISGVKIASSICVTFFINFLSHGIARKKS